MEKERLTKLTSTEIAQLWAQYLNDSGSVCILTFLLEKAEDDEIKAIIEFALNLSSTHIHKLTVLFDKENYKVPHGFKLEEDVDLTAPKLYSDIFVLHFIHQMAKIGLTNYSASVSASVRTDITDYYLECLNETTELYKQSKDLLLSKGVFVRSPSSLNLEHIDYIKKQGFILDVFGEKRPLLVSEISNLFSNIQRNGIGVATLVGFSQVAQQKNVKRFFLKGIEIAEKHIKLFNTKLEENHLPVATSLVSEVTNSTAYTFSDKLMMFFTSGLISLSIGFYGTAVAQSPRLDLGVMYNRLSLEIQLYSEDGSNIMIDNSWLEQPPMALDRDELANKIGK